MDKDIKDLWVAALRSGEYRQGRGVLRRVRADGDVEYCCLGVLCELAERSGVIQSTTEEIGAEKPSPITYYEGSKFFLPALAGEWSGVDFEGNPPVGGGPLEDLTLTEMNDSEEFTFDQIADVINYFF